MENNNGNNGNKFLGGFLLGALIGAGAVFLFNTKKGKKILKSFSENGLDNISEMLQNQEDNVEDDYEEEVQRPIKTSASDLRHSQPRETRPNPEASNGEAKNHSPEKKPLVRRFFRGIGKKI